VINGNDSTFGKFVNRVLGNGLFGISTFLNLPNFLAFGEEEDVETKAFHGFTNVVLKLNHLSVGFVF